MIGGLYRPARQLLGAAAALLAGGMVAAALVGASGAGPAWLGLALGGLAAAALVACSGRPKALLLQLALATLTFDLSKAIRTDAVGYVQHGAAVHLADLFMAGYVLFWLVERVTSRTAPGERAHGLVRLGLAYIGFLWLSAAYAGFTPEALVLATLNTKYFVFFAVLVADLRSAAAVRGALYALAAGLALNLAMLVAQLATGSQLALQGAKTATIGTQLYFEESGLSVFRPSGLMEHPLALAGFLVLGLPVLLAIALPGRTVLGGRRWAALALLAGGAAALVATLSRGGWISFAAAAALLVALMLRARLAGRRQVMVLGLVAAAFAAVAAVAYPATLQRLFLADNRSAESREILADAALWIVQAHPLLGVGLGGYGEAARSASPESLATLPEYQQEVLRETPVHNKYLLLAAETGLLGAAFFAFLLWRMLQVYFGAPRWRSPAERALAIGLCAGLAGEAVFFAFDHCYLDVRMQLLWVWAALLVALVRLQRSPPRPRHAARSAQW